MFVLVLNRKKQPLPFVKVEEPPLLYFVYDIFFHLLCIYFSSEKILNVLKVSQEARSGITRWSVEKGMLASTTEHYKSKDSKLIHQILSIIQSESGEVK